MKEKVHASRSNTKITYVEKVKAFIRDDKI